MKIRNDCRWGSIHSDSPDSSDSSILHNSDIYHCGLKLKNILYCSENKLIDFDSSNSEEKVVVAGTPKYRTPEQQQSTVSNTHFLSTRLDAGKLDSWGAGQVAYYLICGT